MKEKIFNFLLLLAMLALFWASAWALSLTGFPRPLGEAYCTFGGQWPECSTHTGEIK
jgi:hypothetical protein